MSRRKHQIEAASQQVQRLHAAGRLAEAEQGYRQILAADPQHADSLHGLGVIALQTGHPGPALAYLERAIATKPSVALYHVNRAGALLALGRAAEAEAECRTALRLKRNSGEAYQGLGHALADLGRPLEAIAAYQEAVRLAPTLPGLRDSLGLALHDASRLEDAATELRAALAASPQDPAVAGNLAGVLKDLGRLEEAEALYRDLLRRDPQDPRAHYNLGLLLLVAGRFPEAWPEWEWRFRADPALAQRFQAPVWTGGPLEGRTLLVHAEQGMGDMLQFARYLPLLPRDGRIVLEVHPPLVRLLGQVPNVDAVLAIGEALPAHDLRLPMMSLPLALGLTGAGDIPATVPYLAADPARVAAWRSRLDALPGRRIGVVWAGNPERMRMDRRRSLPAAALAPLAAIPGVSLVSLQKGPAAAEAAEAGVAADWTRELTDFTDTAALVAALDLVIGVDTAVIHLAGALARPVWLLNRFDTCWRWERGCADSRWYPTLRQFRQATPGDWTSVVAEAAAALRT